MLNVKHDFQIKRIMDSRLFLDDGYLPIKRLLTYMSMTDDIKARVNTHLSKNLFHLPPLIPSDPTIRTVFVSDEVRDIVTPPWNERWEGLRHSEFRATLDAFTQGETVSVAENPFDKPCDTFLARVDPVADEIWDIRTVEPGQGIRCLGAFGDKNFFIALTWNYRENMSGRDGWRDEIEDCKSEWEKLFSPIPRFQGASLDEYLSEFYAV